MIVGELTETVLPTMYPMATDEKFLERFRADFWYEEGFKKGQDIDGQKSNQARHYLAYTFIQFAAKLA